MWRGRQRFNKPNIPNDISFQTKKTLGRGTSNMLETMLVPFGSKDPFHISPMCQAPESHCGVISLLRGVQGPGRKQNVFFFLISTKFEFGINLE